jgi:RimJ/RimL family protein N-acetyltransferase
VSGAAEVSLRLLREADLDQLGDMLQDPAATGQYAWYGFGSSAALRRRIAEDGAVGPSGGFLAVLADGQWTGYATWYPEYYGGAAGSQAWRFGMALLPAARGRGVGTAATNQLTDYLFATSPVHRIESCVAPDNLVSQRMLDRCGYSREGHLRRAEFRAGQWRDLLLYARLREDA